MEILYKVHNNLYVNLTNKCPCSCTFCLRQDKDRVGESDSLWLDRDPTTDEVVAEFENFDVKSFDEIVFCGFGEPTEALPVLLETAAYIKEEFTLPVRINTNGLGNLIWGRDIVPDLKGLADSVSISLNAPTSERYQELTRSRFGEGSFEAMLDFARKCKAQMSQITMSTVETTITREEEAECQKICDEIGAVYRIRTFGG